MARKIRQEADSGLYHVMVQGVGKEKIFDSERNKRCFIGCLNDNKNNRIFIITYCIMDNHAHLLVKAVSVTELSEYMSNVNRQFAMFYNKTNNRVGYVFRDRFRSECVEDEQYLYACVSYIHNNPVKAKIVEFAEDYAFSGCYDYIHGSIGAVDKEEAAKLFDISALSIIEINNITSDIKWLGDDGEEIGHDALIAAVEEITKKYSLSLGRGLKYCGDRVSDAVKELRSRTGVSFNVLSTLLGVSRATLYRLSEEE